MKKNATNTMVVVAGIIDPETGAFIPCVEPRTARMDLFDSILFNHDPIIFNITHDAVVTHGARRLVDGSWKATRFKSGPYKLYRGDTLNINKGQFMLSLV